MFKRGHLPWNKGLEGSQVAWNKGSKGVMVAWNKGLRNGLKQSDSPHWKGDNVAYRAIHNWIRTYKSMPDLCQECHIKPPSDIHNISGKYIRDLSDWQYVCRSCHMKLDTILGRHPRDPITGRLRKK